MGPLLNTLSHVMLSYYLQIFQWKKQSAISLNNSALIKSLRQFAQN